MKWRPLSQDFESGPLPSIFLNVCVTCGRVHTARKTLISTGREPPVSTGFPPGTVPPVLSARALSTPVSSPGTKRHV